MKKILFFLAADKATEGETAAIAKLVAIAAAPYEVHILNGKPLAYKSATTLSAAAADNSINDSASGFLTAGFRVGMVIDVDGFTGNVVNNVKGATIESVTAGKMILAGAAGAAIVNDSAGETVVISTVETALYGARVIAADYVAGTVPASYKTTGTPIYPVIDPDNPPDAPTLPTTQTVLSDGEAVELDDAGTVTFEIVDGAIESAALEATETVVTTGDVIAVTGGGHVTLTIAGGAITGCAYTAP